MWKKYFKEQKKKKINIQYFNDETKNIHEFCKT